MDILNSCVSTGVILSAVPLNIFAEMPSGPLALDVSRDSNISYTSSSVHKKYTGQLPMLGSSYLHESGGWAMLKHLEKYWVSMEALSKSLVTVVPFLTKARIETLLLFIILTVFQNCFELEGLKFLKK